MQPQRKLPQLALPLRRNQHCMRRQTAIHREYGAYELAHSAQLGKFVDRRPFTDAVSLAVLPAATSPVPSRRLCRRLTRVYLPKPESLNYKLYNGQAQALSRVSLCSLPILDRRHGFRSWTSNALVRTPARRTFFVVVNDVFQSPPDR